MWSVILALAYVRSLASAIERAMKVLQSFKMLTTDASLMGLIFSRVTHMFVCISLMDIVLDLKVKI